MVHSFLTSPLDRGVQIAFHPGNDAPVPTEPVAYPGILLERGGVQQIQLRTEGRENGDLGAVASLVRGYGGSCNLVQKFHFI